MSRSIWIAVAVACLTLVAAGMLPKLGAQFGTPALPALPRLDALSQQRLMSLAEVARALRVPPAVPAAAAAGVGFAALTGVALLLTRRSGPTARRPRPVLRLGRRGWDSGRIARQLGIEHDAVRLVLRGRATVAARQKA